MVLSHSSNPSSKKDTATDNVRGWSFIAESLAEATNSMPRKLSARISDYDGRVDSRVRTDLLHGYEQRLRDALSLFKARSDRVPFDRPRPTVAFVGSAPEVAKITSSSTARRL